MHGVESAGEASRGEVAWWELGISVWGGDEYERGWESVWESVWE